MKKMKLAPAGLLTDLQELYSRIDAEIAAMNLPCAKGCGNCCYYAIFMTTLEGQVIADYLKQLEPEKAQKLASNLVGWINHCQSKPAVDASLRDNDLQEIGNATFTAKIPCPFLLGGECGIYPVRPLICRSYFHGEGPEVCTTGIKDPAFVSYHDKCNKDLIGLHVKHNVPADYTLLPLFCLEMLNSGR